METLLREVATSYVNIWTVVVTCVSMILAVLIARLTRRLTRRGKLIQSADLMTSSNRDSTVVMGTGGRRPLDDGVKIGCEGSTVPNGPMIAGSREELISTASESRQSRDGAELQKTAEIDRRHGEDRRRIDGMASATTGRQTRRAGIVGGNETTSPTGHCLAYGLNNNQFDKESEVDPIDHADPAVNTPSDSSLVPDSWPLAAPTSSGHRDDSDSPGRLQLDSSIPSEPLMLSASDVRGLRAELARERERRIIAEEWSSFLASTLQAYLAARDNYAARPLVLQRPDTDGKSSKSADVVSGFPFPERTPISGCDATGRGRKNRLGRLGWSNDDAETVAAQVKPSRACSSQSPVPDYNCWLAQHRAVGVAGRTGGRGGGGAKTETEEELAEWERAVSYNESVLSNRAYDKQRSIPQRKSKAPDRCSAIENTSRSRTAGTNSCSTQNALSPVDQHDERQNRRSTQHEKCAFDARRKMNGADEQDVSKWQRETRKRENDADASSSAVKQATETNVKQDGGNARQATPDGSKRVAMKPDVTPATTSVNSSSTEVVVGRVVQSDVCHVTSTPMTSSSEGDQRAATQSSNCLTLPATEECNDQEDSEIWSLSVRQRVNSWRRNKMRTALQLPQQQQQQEQQRPITPESRPLAPTVGSGGIERKSSMKKKDDPPTTSNSSRNVMGTVAAVTSPDVASTCAISSADLPPSEAVASAAVSAEHETDHDSRERASDEVVFEPVAKVGEAKALFERIQHQTTSDK